MNKSQYYKILKRKGGVVFHVIDFNGQEEFDNKTGFLLVKDEVNEDCIKITKNEFIEGYTKEVVNSLAKECVNFLYYPNLPLLKNRLKLALKEIERLEDMND